MGNGRFQAQEILDGLIVAQREMDAGSDRREEREARAINKGVRLVRRRFRPEYKDEAERRLRGAWATLKGERAA